MRFALSVLEFGAQRYSQFIATIEAAGSSNLTGNFQFSPRAKMVLAPRMLTAGAGAPSEVFALPYARCSGTTYGEGVSPRAGLVG